MKIDFEFQTEHGLFRDALYLPDEHDLTAEQIDELKLQRLNNWINIITTVNTIEDVAVTLVSEEAIDG